MRERFKEVIRHRIIPVVAIQETENATPLAEALIVGGLPRLTANTITDPEAIREHLKFVRSQGYAIDDEENEKGIRWLGAPIFNGKGKPVAASSVSDSVFQATKKNVHDVIKGAVMAAAAEISRRLGFQDGK